MKRRMFNIFQEDGKAFIVAMDHGTGSPVLPDLKNPANVIDQCVAGGADGFLITPGMAMNLAKHVGNKALILRSDGGSNTLDYSAPFKQSVSVKQAVQIGADAVLCMDFPGAACQKETADSVHNLVREGLEYNIPVGVEPLDFGFEFGQHDNMRSAENITLVARMAVERGADFVKVPYTGDKESFKELVESCYVPVLVLGGNKTDDYQKYFQDLRDALDAGAKGVIIGRNVYNYKNPQRMAETITRLVHKNYTVEEALDHLNS